MKVGAFVVARLSSTRLPAKNLLPIMGKPMIQHLIERVKRAPNLHLVGIATSVDPSDDPLQTFAETLGVPCHRGSLENVMERMSTAAEAFDCDAVVEILGDNPLVHSDLIEEVVKIFCERGLDYAANITAEYGDIDPQLRRFPIGVRIQAYRASVAKQWRDYPEFLKKDLGTTAYIFCNPRPFRCGYVAADGAWASLHEPKYHFAVNYQKNFRLVERIFEALYPKDPNFSLQAVMSYVRQNRDLESLMGG